MNGNSTIRALDSNKYEIAKDHENNNQNMLAQYVETSTSQWYSIQTKYSQTLFMVITVILIVQQRNASNAVILSMAISEIMSIGGAMTNLIARVNDIE